MDFESIIILITGSPGSGSDTCALHIRDSLGYSIVHFSDSLKDLVSKEWKIPRDVLDDPDKLDLPLENFPVNGSTELIECVHMSIVTLFRTLCGDIPSADTFSVDASGACKRGFDQLYWTPRALLTLECNLKSAIKPDYWVSRMTLPGEYLVIPDWTTPAEYHALCRKSKYRVIRVKINTSLSKSEGPLGSSDFDYIISNTGDLGDLLKQVDALIQTIVER